MQKIKIGVLMGGKSIEREVSFNSGRTICDHLDTSLYEIIPLFQLHTGALFILPWKFLYRGKITDFEHRLTTEAQKISWDSFKSLVDFIYIALHGAYAEDGTLQGFLEIVQIPYLGSKLFGSALSMNKIMQKKFLKHGGVSVPLDVVISAHEYKTISHTQLEEKLHEQSISFPCIVKPAHEGSSFGVTIVHSLEELPHALHYAATIDPKRIQDVLIEQKIEGMEFSCIILGNLEHNDYLVLPPTEIIAETSIFDYEQKYMPGRATKYTPARCSTEDTQLIQETCLRVMRILQLTMARIDGFLTRDGVVVIIDPNSLPGMSPSSFLFRQAAELNMNHTQIINYLIENELKYTDKKSMIPSTNRSQSLEKKIRVGVLFGGRSNEKEISLESGRNILYKLSPEKYDPIALFVSSSLQIYILNQKILVRNSTKEIQEDLSEAIMVEWNDLPNIVDFAFIGLHGGEGESGSVQGTLEMLAIPYNGSSVLTSALCMNKFKTNEFLRAEGFDVPESILISAQSWFVSKYEITASIQQKFTFPLIVKPHDDGCSVLVTKITSAEQFEQFVDTVFTTGQKTYLLIEELIKGTELTVGVIGNHKVTALPPSQAIAQNDILSIEEKFLPGAGENQTPANLPQEALQFVQTTMENVYRAVGAKGYARIDCFYQSALQSPTGNERVVTLEINTLPGMTPATCIFHQAAEVGIKPMDFIDMIIALGFEEHKKSGVNAYDIAQEVYIAQQKKQPTYHNPEELQ
jgi:UDP-N-acetylmuramate--alanine ligase